MEIMQPWAAGFNPPRSPAIQQMSQTQISLSREEQLEAKKAFRRSEFQL